MKTALEISKHILTTKNVFGPTEFMLAEAVVKLTEENEEWRKWPEKMAEKLKPSADRLEQQSQALKEAEWIIYQSASYTEIPSIGWAEKANEWLHRYGSKL